MDNYYLADPVLRRYLRVVLGEDLEEAERLLVPFGEICFRQIAPRAVVADRYGPRLVNFDPEGNRIDEIEYHPAYHEMEKIAYEYGLVWRFYEPPLARKRITGFALGYLFSQAESGLFCPICMTDGAAYVLRRHADRAIQDRFLPHLLSKRREDLYQGAMFLTEKQGGSDVGRTETRAVPKGDGTFLLYGDKWFCSNVDAECILALAREEGAPEGTGGLSLFAVPRFLDDGSRNALIIHRLKEKLGTRSMPTGEVTLDGALAYRVGEKAKGFKLMADMLNLSRLYNAVASVSGMQRAILESTAFVEQRVAFGKVVAEHPLMRRRLLEMRTEHEANFYLVFAGVCAMDQIEAGEGDESKRRLLRILTPLMKYFSAKEAVRLASEAVEALGGNGYVETFVTPRLLRDAQVLPIWEGTTNILVLDAFRAMAKEQAHEAFFDRTGYRLESVSDADLEPLRRAALELQHDLQETLPLFAARFDDLASHAKEVTDAMVRLYQAAEWLGVEQQVEPAQRHLDTLTCFFADKLPLARFNLARVRQRMQEGAPAL